VHVRFEWDENKNRSNYRKHGLTFDTAAKVFNDPDFVMLPDREIDGEERWQTVGRVGGVMLIVVVHTIRDENNDEVVRIISARHLDAHERRRYDKVITH
jgi:uncharacterized DUF497 family protein